MTMLEYGHLMDTPATIPPTPEKRYALAGREVEIQLDPEKAATYMQPRNFALAALLGRAGRKATDFSCRSKSARGSSKVKVDRAWRTVLLLQDAKLKEFQAAAVDRSSGSLQFHDHIGVRKQVDKANVCVRRFDQEHGAVVASSEDLQIPA